MINRRHIRVKVMQSMYAMQQSKNDDVVKDTELPTTAGHYVLVYNLKTPSTECSP